MDKMNINQNYFVYNRKEEGIYPLVESDWFRLKDLINKIVPEEKTYNIVASFTIGIFVSSLFFLISLNTIKEAPNWMVVVGWVLLLSSFFISFAFIIVDRQQKKIIKISKEFIIQEMENIEKVFEKHKDE